MGTSSQNWEGRNFPDKNLIQATGRMRLTEEKAQRKGSFLKHNTQCLLLNISVDEAIFFKKCAGQLLKNLGHFILCLNIRSNIAPKIKILILNFY